MKTILKFMEKVLKFMLKNKDFFELESWEIAEVQDMIKKVQKMILIKES